jgi:hypothetical protein
MKKDFIKAVILLLAVRPRPVLCRRHMEIPFAGKWNPRAIRPPQAQKGDSRFMPRKAFACAHASSALRRKTQTQYAKLRHILRTSIHS